jgi:hypothetical protein
MDEYNWKVWFSNEVDTSAIIHYIKHHETLDMPHVFFINGPPFTGKKTFAKVITNVLSNHPHIAVINATNNGICTEPNKKLCFIIGHSYPTSIDPRFLNGRYTYSTIIFTRQFIHNQRLWSESWLTYCENTLRADLNMNYELVLPSPASRQSSYGSCFITSPPISRQVSDLDNVNLLLST